ncbi:DUF5062 family protein [Motilimonas eburnea]|uniref:DUF5062 family protein n=1 Tax=Motilimonas eburnea TaxID=1737488 RepID=UPI001E4DFB79|nr:DUF5062 family protein [Motilimonas eburnea]MCE2572579.1 DUF5062 family protein [Motilimonas eburnea]
MKKVKNEAQLLKKALEIGLKYAEQRGYGKLDSHISQKDKVEVVYRLLVQDKQITPIPADKEDGQQLKHKLIIWISRMLPADHELLK